MCGRDTFFATWAQVREFSMPLPVTTPADDPSPAYNRAPTQTGWVLLPTSDGAEARPMRWGLIPFWAKDLKIGYSTINARVETASSKPAFREAWKRRRCLVPSSGYYEWQQLSGKHKQAWYIRNAEAPLLMFAGLWDHWRGPDGEIESYSIITRSAAGPISTVHDRMPLILPPSMLGDWLGGDPLAVADAAPLPDLRFHPVAPAVGNVRQQGEGLVAPISPAEALSTQPLDLLGDHR